MGIRDWPSQVYSESWVDECDDNALRYVLEGSGTVSRLRDGTLDGGLESIAVAPNTLVTVTEACSLSWVLDAGAEMVVLTPEYKGPPLGLVAGGLFGALAVLVATSFGGS